MKAIIFDFDGTIGDSFKIVAEVFHSLTGRNDLVSPEEIVRLRKMRLLNVARELGISRWQLPFLMIRGRRAMTRRLPEVQPFNGIVEVLDTLKHQGHQLFIMSSNSTTNVELFLAEHDLGRYFEQVHGGVSLLGKARALRKIIRRNGLDKASTIYIGDEPRDIEASKRVGIDCVAVAWGYNAPELLLEHTPLAVVSQPAELTQVLTKWGEQ